MVVITYGTWLDTLVYSTLFAVLWKEWIYSLVVLRHAIISLLGGYVYSKSGNADINIHQYSAPISDATSPEYLGTKNADGYIINGTGHEFSTTNDIKIVKMTGNGTVFLNNSQIHNFNKSYTGGEKLWLFWGNSGDWKNVYGRIKLYYAKVWQDNTLVRNYMPVLRKEDNKVGLFDIQNNQFYTDVNNGNFTAGPEIN